MINLRKKSGTKVKDYINIFVKILFFNPILSNNKFNFKILTQSVQDFLSRKGLEKLS